MFTFAPKDKNNTLLINLNINDMKSNFKYACASIGNTKSGFDNIQDAIEYAYNIVKEHPKSYVNISQYLSESEIYVDTIACVEMVDSEICFYSAYRILFNINPDYSVEFKSFVDYYGWSTQMFGYEFYTEKENDLWIRIAKKGDKTYKQAFRKNAANVYESLYYKVN